MIYRNAVVIVDLTQYIARHGDVSPSALPIRYFPEKSGHSATFMALGRLTHGLLDVGTGGDLHRGLIRNQQSSLSTQGLLKTAFKVPSLRYQSLQTLKEYYQGTDRNGAFETQDEKRRRPW